MNASATKWLTAWFLLCSWWLMGCDRDTGDDKLGDADVRPISMTPSHEHWKNEGFVEMVPPIRLPSDQQGRGKTEVWISFPDAPLPVITKKDGQPTIGYPPGTVVDRVEMFTPKDGGPPQVMDVRGTTFGEGGREEFHVLHRVGDMLRGFAWQRGDAAAQARANQYLAQLLRADKSATRKQEPAIARLVTLNACAHCHVPNKPANRRLNEGGLPNRATDAGGLYQVQTVFQGEVPIETSRPREMNLRDPFVTFGCPPPNQPQMNTTDRGIVQVRCPDDAVPTGAIDVPKALQAGDARVKRLCDARKALFAHLDPKNRDVFAKSMAMCEKNDTKL